MNSDRPLRLESSLLSKYNTLCDPKLEGLDSIGCFNSAKLPYGFIDQSPCGAWKALSVVDKLEIAQYLIIMGSASTDANLTLQYCL